MQKTGMHYFLIYFPAGSTGQLSYKSVHSERKFPELIKTVIYKNRVHNIPASVAN